MPAEHVLKLRGLPYECNAIMIVDFFDGISAYRALAGRHLSIQISHPAALIRDSRNGSSPHFCNNARPDAASVPLVFSGCLRIPKSRFLYGHSDTNRWRGSVAPGGVSVGSICAFADNILHRSNRGATNPLSEGHASEQHEAPLGRVLRGCVRWRSDEDAFGVSSCLSIAQLLPVTPQITP